MKNLFKNLMLVAVAAMAFTACQNDNNEVNEVAKKTVISGVLSFDEETRSGFVGTESTDNGDGTTTTVYKSAWDGGETIKLFAENGLETTATVNTEGEFTAEFEGELPESFFMTVCSPAESWSSQYNSTIPAEQTPRANSVDPNAHLLQAQNVYVSNGTADAIVMGHQVAYGKMTVNAPEGFVIDNVVVNLKGTYYQNYERECTYTINADNVQNNVFWFTTETFENVTEFTVTAYDAEGIAVAKTVDVAAAGKTLAFNYGRVSTFSVSGLEKPAVPAFTSAKLTGDWFKDNQFTFVDESGELLDLAIDLASSSAYNNDDTLILEGEYTIEDCYLSGFTKYGIKELGAVNIKVTHIQGGYHIEFSNIKDTNGNLLLDRAIFEGPIIGYGNPDLRTPLATPEVTYELNGKTLTVSWTPVDGAVGYRVHDYYYDIDTTTTKTSLTVELTEYQWYYIYVSAVAAADDANFKNSAEAEVSFELKDTRTVLPAPSNVRATIDGRYATIEWDAVEGADYYTLSYYLNGNQVVDVEGTSHTIDVGFSVSDLWVYVFAKANDDNENYKSSESWDACVEVNTGKDPSIWADVLLSAPIADTYNSYGFCFKMNFTDGSGKYIRLFFNEADRPGNKSLNTGVYYGIGNGSSDTYNPGVGKFAATMFDSWGRLSGYYARHFTSASTVEVSYDEAVGYTIVLTHGDKTYGYKGMPEGWVVPSEGGSGNEGDSGDDNTGDEGDGFIQMTKLYYDDSAANLHNFILTNADQSSKIILSFNNQDVRTTWIPAYTYASKGINAVNGNTGYFTLQYNRAKINGTSYDLGATGHTLKVLSASNGGNHEMELYVVTSNGTEYKFKFSGNLGL